MSLQDWRKATRRLKLLRLGRASQLHRRASTLRIKKRRQGTRNLGHRHRMDHRLPVYSGMIIRTTLRHSFARQPILSKHLSVFRQMPCSPWRSDLIRAQPWILENKDSLLPAWRQSAGTIRSPSLHIANREVLSVEWIDSFFDLMRELRVYACFGVVKDFAVGVMLGTLLIDFCIRGIFTSELELSCNFRPVATLLKQKTLNAIAAKIEVIDLQMIADHRTWDRGALSVQHSTSCHYSCLFASSSAGYLHFCRAHDGWNPSKRHWTATSHDWASPHEYPPRLAVIRLYCKLDGKASQFAGVKDGRISS